MAHDFRRKTLIPRRFSPSIESPGVPVSPLESTPVVEIFWRRRLTLGQCTGQGPGWRLHEEPKLVGRTPQAPHPLDDPREYFRIPDGDGERIV